MHGCKLLRGPIRGSRRLKAGTVYVVAGAVRVCSGAVLTIEDGVTVLIRNGLVETSPVGRAALIFEHGSELRAQRVQFRACDEFNRPARKADNGGVWFMGTYRSAAKDGMRVSATPGSRMSRFRARMITAHFLGRHDPAVPRQGDQDDDLDGLSVLGVGPQEWYVDELRSFHSGDDGLDLTNSHILIARLRITSPTEDGINLSSSLLQITRSVFVDVKRTSVTDREIFDFEVDDGPSYLEIARGCRVQFRGNCGDELRVAGDDMRGLRKLLATGEPFKCNLPNSPALFYSLIKD